MAAPRWASSVGVATGVAKHSNRSAVTQVQQQRERYDGGKGHPVSRWPTEPGHAGWSGTGELQPGTGAIVTGTAANKAKAAALAACPGGIVNRVVLLSDGEYNVHMIGVNWPHHVFVSTNFKVVGAG
jgi:hypothetical protein